MKNKLQKYSLAAAALVMMAAGMSCVQVKSDEVGVRVLNVPFVNRIFETTEGQGLHFYVPYIFDYYKLPTTVQSLRMVEEGEALLREAERPVEAAKAIHEQARDAEQEKPQNVAQEQLEAVKQEIAQPFYYKIAIHDRPAKEQSVRVKTADGNDAWVDVIVTYEIIPEEAWKVAKNFEMKNGLDEIEHTVESMTRGIVRARMGALNSEQIIEGSDQTLDGMDGRKKARGQAETMLNDQMSKFGIRVVMLSAPAVTIHPEFEDVLNKTRIAKEERQEYISYKKQAVEEKKTKVNKAKGEAYSMEELAKGRYQRVTKEADAELDAMTLKAEALYVKFNNMADGIAAQAEAMSGPGGDEQVGLAIAEAMQGKKIIIVPGQGALNMLDLNDILQTYGAARAIKIQGQGADQAPSTTRMPETGE